ncbi:MAG: DNA polymerase III subunit gamma/tau [Actinomycetota bacterium]
MSYVSLYRKYRPQTFEEVVGQDHVGQTLRRGVLEGRIHHALLFSGPRGTGKTSTARILSKALNCEKHLGDPCNDCPSCLEITEGASVDVIEIDAASHGSVDDARDIREKVAFAALAGRWKVYIIDECHMLSPAANNALLKVLEEPPAHVVFVFATTEPHKVLQTLVDRCQRYEFRAVGAVETTKRLTDVCTAEGITVDEDALRLIAGRAGGSVRDALGLLDQLRSYRGDTIDAEAVTAMLGSVPEDLLFEAVDLISERDAGAMFVFTDRLVRSGADIRVFVSGLVSHLRSLFLIQHAPAAEEILNVPDEKIERLRAQANHFDGAEILRLIDLANETQVQMRQAIEARLALEVALARMTRPELHAAPASLVSRIERLERLLDGRAQPALSTSVPPRREPAPAAPGAPPQKGNGLAKARERLRAISEQPLAEAPPDPAVGQPVVERPSPEGPVDLDRVLRAWPLVLEKVKRRKIGFHALLQPARPVGYADDVLILQFDSRSRFHKDQVSDRTRQDPLLDALEEVLSVRPVVKCVVEEDPPTSPEGGLGSTAPDRAETAGDYDDVSQEASPDQPAGQEDSHRSPIDLVREAFAGTEVVQE